MPVVIVVGAGAAGIFAAWRAASLGAEVILLEKTDRIGTKILISGGGKCNVAHAGSIEQVLRAFRRSEAAFIRPACYRLKNTDIIDMVTSRGLEVYTRPDGRVFPVDQTAKDVVRILRSYLDDVGVSVRLKVAVEGVIVENGAAVGVRTSEGLVRGDAVVLCVGGASYPGSGTTGDGWKWTRDIGHTIQPIRAALAPIYLPTEASRSGVAVRDVVLKARTTKEIARWRGDLLFTHKGVSGPCALGISREVAEAREPVGLFVDLVPSLSFEAVTEQLVSLGSKHPHRRLATWFADFVPESLVADVLLDAAVDVDVSLGKLDRKSRNRFLETIKSWSLGRVSTVPMEKGEVTAGGVSLEEVDPQTMASRLVARLFLCGEMLDVAGPVGGYNLQAAFATGYVAGESAAQVS